MALEWAHLDLWYFYRKDVDDEEYQTALNAILESQTYRSVRHESDDEFDKKHSKFCNLAARLKIDDAWKCFNFPPTVQGRAFQEGHPNFADVVVIQYDRVDEPAEALDKN